MNASTVGYHTRFWAKSAQMETEPIVSPKASLTQAYSPPSLGQLVASSELTSAAGIKKAIAPSRYQKIRPQPNSAIDGKVRNDSTAATLIIPRVNTPSLE